MVGDFHKTCKEIYQNLLTPVIIQIALHRVSAVDRELSGVKRKKYYAKREQMQFVLNDISSALM